jgi:hypothetical protein
MLCNAVLLSAYVPRGHVLNIRERRQAIPNGEREYLSGGAQKRTGIA